ncbi:TPA: DUF551 domain-containing protein [Salmonella enterica subsp. enterica serovar Birkenhead]
MSTITKERLARIYEENESLAMTNEQLRTELKAAKDRIAELEARTVTLPQRLQPDELSGLFIRVNNMFFQVAVAGDDCDESLREQAIPLYTAPPVPVVPEEITVEAAYPDVQTGWDNAKYYAIGWNACRAAMLNRVHVGQPASDAQWIKCSERLPPEEYEPDGGAVFYLVWNKRESETGTRYDLSNVVFLRRHWEKWYSHWMPLPEAPKPEKAND